MVLMPNCFQLIKIGEQEPSILQEIDRDLWNHFEGNVPEPDNKWYLNWYNTIGFSLSCGNSWEEIRELCLTDRIKAVVDYLAANYRSCSFYSPK